MLGKLLIRVYKYFYEYSLATKATNICFHSLLETDFLVLRTESFDVILDSPHKNSLIAFFMAIVNVSKQVWVPFEKSNE